MNNNFGLSYSTRNALAVQVGEEAGNEIANLLQRMSAQIEELKRSKVNVTPVVPGIRRDDDDQHIAATLESESF